MSPKKSGRPWGMGGVYQVGGRWYVHYPGPAGQVKESTGAGSTRAKAEALLEKRLREVENHRDGFRRFSGRRGERLLVKDLLQLVEDDYKTRKLASWRAVGYHSKRVRERLGNERAARVDDRSIRDFIAARRADKVQDSTIDRELEVLRRGFRLGKDAGIVAWTPPIPRLVRANTNARQGFLDPLEIDALLAGIDDPDYRDLVEWLAWTGMRPGEAASFTWTAYDRATGTLRLEARHAKTRQARVLPLILSLASIIKRREAARRLDCNLIFHRAGKSPVYSGGKLGITQVAVGSVIQRARARGVVIPSYRKLALEAQLTASKPTAPVAPPAGARRHSCKPQHERDAKIVEACKKESREDVALRFKVSRKVVQNVLFRARKKGQKTPPPAPKPASQPVVRASLPAPAPPARPRGALSSPPVRRKCRSCANLFDAATVAGLTVYDCPGCRKKASDEIEDGIRAAHDPILDNLPLTMEHRH